MGPRRPVARSFGASVERGLHLSIGMVILTKTLVFAAQFGSWDRSDPVELLLAGLVIGCVGTAAVRCLASVPTGFDVFLCTVALVGGSLMPRDHVPLSGAADSPIIHLVEPMLMVIAVRRHRAVVPMLLLAGLFVGLRWATGDTEGLRYGAQEVVLICGTAFAALYLVTQMRRASARAEEVIATNREVHRAHLSVAELDTAAFLHDDLVPTLLAVGSMPGSPDTRSAAASALARLTGPSHGEDVSDVVAALRAAAGREMLDVEVVVKGPRTHLPEAVREAMVGAATEALRNVARHSGQRHATLTVVRRPTGLRIRIEDPGTGFSGKPGVGMRVAIIGRVESIGGTARVDGIASGTVVELVWRARIVSRLLGLAPEHDRLIRAAVIDPGRVARHACAVLAAGYLATAALLTLDIPPQPWLYAGAALIVAMVLVLTVAMSRGPVHPVVLLVVAVVPPGVLALTLPSVSAEGMGGAESWIIEFSTLPALALAWVVSVRMVLLLLLPNAVVITLVALDVGAPAADLPHILFVQPLNAMFVAVIVSVCRRAGRVLTEPAAPEVTARAAAVLSALGPTLRPVVVALRAVGAPDAPTEPSPTRLAQAVRDCLYLPGPGHEALRTELDMLRRAGVRVHTILAESPPATRTLAAALGAVRGTGIQEVTISGTSEEVTIVAVPGPAPEVAERLPRLLPVAWQVTAEPEASVLSGPPDLATLIRRGGRQPVRG
ncbi:MULTISPECIES: hypothetical protein [unclassified Nocardioides]|uniref:ATP-binding protein n=1 Tax=unclassified Nocardioides TaxID=2615069 RepID=UPI000AE9E591|nr:MULTISPECIES: hypothetical protein [unclassified Nocardioides]